MNRKLIFMTLVLTLVICNTAQASDFYDRQIGLNEVVVRLLEQGVGVEEEQTHMILSLIEEGISVDEIVLNLMPGRTPFNDPRVERDLAQERVEMRWLQEDVVDQEERDNLQAMVRQGTLQQEQMDQILGQQPFIPLNRDDFQRDAQDDFGQPQERIGMFLLQEDADLQDERDNLRAMVRQGTLRQEEMDLILGQQPFIPQDRGGFQRDAQDDFEQRMGEAIRIQFNLKYYGNPEGEVEKRHVDFRSIQNFPAPGTNALDEWEGFNVLYNMVAECCRLVEKIPAEQKLLALFKLFDEGNETVVAMVNDRRLQGNGFISAQVTEEYSYGHILIASGLKILMGIL